MAVGEFAGGTAEAPVGISPKPLAESALKVVGPDGTRISQETWASIAGVAMTGVLDVDDPLLGDQVAALSVEHEERAVYVFLLWTQEAITQIATQFPDDFEDRLADIKQRVFDDDE